LPEIRDLAKNIGGIRGRAVNEEREEFASASELVIKLLDKMDQSSAIALADSAWKKECESYRLDTCMATAGALIAMQRMSSIADGFVEDGVDPTTATIATQLILVRTYAQIILECS
jgi:hypothetical protein